MFMLNSTHRKLCIELEDDYDSLKVRFNKMLNAAKVIRRELDEVEDKLDFMYSKHSRLQVESQREIRELKLMYGAGHKGSFDKKELRTLLGLCHPDKHGGREGAVKMFQKLSNMRDERNGRS